MQISHMLRAGWMVLALAVITACGGGGSGTAVTGNGTLSLSLTDAATDQYRAIYITIDDVQVHLGGSESDAGNWRSIDMPASPMTLDLLQLVNGVREDLGLSDLPAGRYTQMRLILGRTPDDSLNLLSQAHPHPNYLIRHGDTDNIRELKVPSGYNSGVKIVNGFQIQAGQTTELVLDFDACRSVVKAGNSGNWHLKPTIKVADLHEYAIVQGNVGNGTQGIEGALVSVQVEDPQAADPADRVRVVAATVTDEFGDYSIFVAPGDYHLVAYQDGHLASASKITLTAGQVLDTGSTHFLLAATPPGRVTGTVILTNAGAEQYATLSFRQSVTIDDDTAQIEIDTVNVLDATTFDVGLPAGDYTLVASSAGYPTQASVVTVSAGSTTREDVTLAP